MTEHSVFIETITPASSEATTLATLGLTANTISFWSGKLFITSGTSNFKVFALEIVVITNGSTVVTKNLSPTVISAGGTINTSDADITITNPSGLTARINIENASGLKCSVRSELIIHKVT